MLFLKFEPKSASLSSVPFFMAVGIYCYEGRWNLSVNYKKRSNIRCGGTKIYSTYPQSLHGGLNFLIWGNIELPRQIEVALQSHLLNFFLTSEILAKNLLKMHVNQPLKFLSFLLISQAVDIDFKTAFAAPLLFIEVKI